MRHPGCNDIGQLPLCLTGLYLSVRGERPRCVRDTRFAICGGPGQHLVRHCSQWRPLMRRGSLGLVYGYQWLFNGQIVLMPLNTEPPFQNVSL
jgi:hypothetical protein